MLKLAAVLLECIVVIGGILLGLVLAVAPVALGVGIVFGIGYGLTHNMFGLSGLAFGLLVLACAGGCACCCRR